MKRIYLLFVPFLFFLVSCSEKALTGDCEFTVSTEDGTLADAVLDFGGSKAEASLEIVCSDSAPAWKIKCSLDDVWCRYECSGNTLVVSVEDNVDPRVRETSLSIVVGDNEMPLTIRQDFLRLLSVPETEVPVISGGGRVSVPYSSNLPPDMITARTAATWISGLDITDGSISFVAAKNASVENMRDALVLVLAGETVIELHVVQDKLAGYPYVVSLETVDLEAWPVYEIWDEVHDIKIGELCREFLYSADAAGNVTVKKRCDVAYGAVAGKTLYTDGLVLNDGGSVSWDETSISGYAPGVLSSAPTVIYCGTGSRTFSVSEPELDEVEKALLTEAVCRPLKVTDHRTGVADNEGNTVEEYSYSVRKIGMQYWLRENLRASRFTDGTPVPTAISDAAWAAMCDASKTDDLLPACKICCPRPDRWQNANDPAASQLREKYGLNYNFAAVIGSSVNISSESSLDLEVSDALCPQGWSVPTVRQWQWLIGYVNPMKSGSVSEYFPLLLSDADGEDADLSGFSGTGMQWGSAKGGYNTGIYYALLNYYGYSAPGTDLNTTGHLMTVGSLRTDRNFTQTNVNVGCAVYVRCIRK